MDITRFIFWFLYARNWHTGEHELSRPRVTLFAAAVTLILLAVAIAAILQSPVQYVAP